MKRKILSLILIILVAMFAMATTVNALSFTATMSTNSTTVPEATEFTVKVKVSNLDVGTNGINFVQGTLKYDADIFETISESSIQGLNSWEIKSYDNTTGKIILTKKTFVTSTQEVLQITLKTKEGVTGKKGTISFGEISASNNETEITATDISTSITVGTEETPSNTTNTANTVKNTTNTISIAPTLNTSTVGNTTNNTANKTANNVTNNSTVSSYVNTMTNTSSSQNMPKTGVSDTLLILTTVAIAVALGFYIKIEKLNKDIK